MHAPELSGLYFAGMREGVQRMKKEDARIKRFYLMLLDENDEFND